MPKPAEIAPINKPSDYSKFDEEDGPFWVCEKDAIPDISFAETGLASAGVVPAMTLPQMLALAVKRAGNKVAFRTENMPPLLRGQDPPEPLPLKDWKGWTWKEYQTDACRVGRAFMDLGVEMFDTVSIFGFNSPEWFLSAMGAAHCGAKFAGIYSSDTATQVQYKAFHSDTAVAVVENQSNFEKFAEVIDELPYLKAVVCWAYEANDLVRADGTKVRVLTFPELLKLGDSVEMSALEERVSQVVPGMCAALVYTSGTTGRPKAAMISHDNLIFESSAVLPNLNGACSKREEERLISYLPLSHVAGLMVDFVSSLCCSATKKAWMSVSFARPYDLKVGTLGQRLVVVEPTIFMGVPRVWEKIAEKLLAVGAKTTGIKKKLSEAAKRRGLEYQRDQQIGCEGRNPGFGPLGIYKKLLNLIKLKLGLSKCKYAFAGAAPMARETLLYFGALNININEAYGMSECTGAATWGTDSAHQWGTVGYEMPGCEIRVFKFDSSGRKTECPRTYDILHATEEEQGEICFRGRMVMMGYLANPKLGDEHVEDIKSKNDETIDSEGWLHSGDKGAISTQGMIKITGRFKELIIGAGGENVAPVPIEDAIKARLPFVSNAMMVGDQRKFMAVLLTLRAKGATGELPGTKELIYPAKQYGETIEEACENKEMIQEIIKQLKEIGSDGDVTPSNAARIQKFTILPLDFSVATEELTATLKLKRSVVHDKYQDIIDAFYESKEVFVPYSKVGSYDVDGHMDDNMPEERSYGDSLGEIDDEVNSQVLAALEDERSVR
mmetsp:Transcript_21713/g.42659  ORF Transcript_21713/g.42659 Transcript_21713/m.42659 type:complete len:781 (+) Transcript_21713:406-2748(+)